MTQHYIGTKQITAKEMTLGGYNAYRQWTIPADEDPTKKGYLVTYSDGYQSWSPKEIFESAYLPMGEDNDGSTVTKEMVEGFIAEARTVKSGLKTTVVTLILRNGFEITETSSCVDPKNYDHELGREIATSRATDKVWILFGFLLQSARNGITRPTNPKSSG